MGANAQAQDLPDTMLPLQIDEVIFEDGQLIAIGSLGDTTFTSPVDLSLADISDDLLADLLAGADNPDNVCDILSLELQSIHLDLLGLQVDTSDICLLVAAEEGEGKLLGNLLCGVAGLLDGGLSLEDVLGLLTEDELDQLLGGITDLLNGALEEVTSPLSVAGVSGTKPNHGQGQGKGQGKGQGNSQGFNKQCDILNLAVGPLNLNLLGLSVYLDDCAGGPVTVDITAQPGQGKLLGNLLCGLAGLLDDDLPDLDAIADLLNEIAGLLDEIVGAVEL